jgi:hypothetical protein
MEYLERDVTRNAEKVGTEYLLQSQLYVQQLEFSGRKAIFSLPPAFL